jgi:hypothetical protein
MKSASNEEDKIRKNKLYSVTDSRENAKIVVNLDKSFQCKNRSNHNGGNNGNEDGGNYYMYCSKLGHDKNNCFKLKNKEARNNHSYNFSGKMTGETTGDKL